MMIALIGLNANAAMYIVGDAPFGGWNPPVGVEMTELNDGTFKYDATFTQADVYFIFASAVGDWTTVNANRYDCGQSVDLTVEPGVEFTVVQGNSEKSFKFSGTVGQTYTITFNPTTLKAKVEGYVEPITEFTYTVAGKNEIDIFGTEWDPSNTANDMTLDATDGLYKLEKKNIEITAGYNLEYKVVQNHSWGTNWGQTPNGQNQNYYFEENGTYDLTFLFDLENEVVSLDVQQTQVGPAIDPYTGKLYMVGNVNDNAWNPANGIAMLTEDEDTFTLANAEIKDAGDGFGYFSFMAVLGTGAESWPADGYRIGAAEDATLATLNEYNNLGGFGTTGAFKVEPGYYNVTVVLSGGENGYLMLTAGQAPQPVVDDVYIIGDVNEIGWSATQGVKMTYNEGIYTATITTQNQGDLGMAYFGFTKKLAEVDDSTAWDVIAPFRFGPVSEDAFVMTEELLNVNCDLATDGSYNSIAIPAGTWTVTVDLVNNKFAINGEWPSVEPEHYDGDVYIMGEVNDNGGWFTNKGVKMTRDAENNVYTATITTVGENEGYSYFSFTKQLAEGEADWDAIAPYRFGAVTDGNPFLVTEELLGDTLALVYNADPRAFQIEAGEWNLTLSVDKMTLVIEKAASVIRGDVNKDGKVNISDVTSLIDLLLSGGEMIPEGDCNLDDAMNISDVTALIDYLLGGNW